MFRSTLRTAALMILLGSGYRQTGDTSIAIAFVTDPWKACIELTENLAQWFLREAA